MPIESLLCVLDKYATEPTRTAAQLTVEERVICETRIGSAAHSYRTKALWARMSVVLFVLSLITTAFVGSMFQTVTGQIVAITGFACSVVSFVFGQLIAPCPPRCSNCSNQIGVLLGRYCPTCGKERRTDALTCECCGAWLFRRRSRSYVVKFCSQCGLKITDIGI